MTPQLEAIEAVGVEAPYLCHGGARGQCQTAVDYLAHYDDGAPTSPGFWPD